MGKKILIVDDEAVIQRLCRRLISTLGHDVVGAGSVTEGTRVMEGHVFDLLISDLKLPDGDGLEMVRRFHSRFPDAKLMVMTGFGSEDDRAHLARRLGVEEYLTKPFEIGEFTSAIKRSLP